MTALLCNLSDTFENLNLSKKKKSNGDSHKAKQAT